MTTIPMSEYSRRDIHRDTKDKDNQISCRVDWSPRRLLPSATTVCVLIFITVIPLLLIQLSSIYAPIPAIVHGNSMSMRQNDGTRLTDSGSSLGGKLDNPLAHLPFKKSMGDPFSRFYRYPLAHWIVETFSLASTFYIVSPSFISAFHLCLAIIAGYLVTLRPRRMLVIAAVLFEIRSFLDCLDGELARGRKRWLSTEGINGGQPAIVTDSYVRDFGYRVDYMCDLTGTICFGCGLLYRMWLYGADDEETTSIGSDSMGVPSCGDNKDDSTEMNFDEDKSDVLAGGSSVGFAVTQRHNLSLVSGSTKNHFVDEENIASENHLQIIANDGLPSPHTSLIPWCPPWLCQGLSRYFSSVIVRRLLSLGTLLWVLTVVQEFLRSGMNDRYVMLFTEAFEEPVIKAALSGGQVDLSENVEVAVQRGRGGAAHRLAMIEAERGALPVQLLACMWGLTNGDSFLTYLVVCAFLNLVWRFFWFFATYGFAWVVVLIIWTEIYVLSLTRRGFL